jgi:hypothetical protein
MGKKLINALFTELLQKGCLTGGISDCKKNIYLQF